MSFTNGRTSLQLSLILILLGPGNPNGTAEHNFDIIDPPTESLLSQAPVPIRQDTRARVVVGLGRVCTMLDCEGWVQSNGMVGRSDLRHTHGRASIP
jgi:hypothetical protein